MSYRCQKCGIFAPTRKVAFHRNIGLVVLRRRETTEGDLCRDCIGDTFWRYTLVNLTAGWWGLLSLFVVPVFTVSNLANYLGSLRLLRAADVPPHPLLSDELVACLSPHKGEILTCLRQGDPPEWVAASLTERVNVTAAQALVYVRFEAALRR